jgi:hypothetical protein
MDSTDEDGTIVLAVRACRDIKQHEAILVHYNPGGGIETWKNVFQCGCCQCRGVCRPLAQRTHNGEVHFRTTGWSRESTVEGAFQGLDHLE